MNGRTGVASSHLLFATIKGEGLSYLVEGLNEEGAKLLGELGWGAWGKGEVEGQKTFGFFLSMRGLNEAVLLGLPTGGSPAINGG